MQGASRPWDKGRDGFVMGEGAGVLLMESLEHAQARGANIICEYLGSAITCDAHHMTDPRPDGSGVGMCIENALGDAGERCSEPFFPQLDLSFPFAVTYLLLPVMSVQGNLLLVASIICNPGNHGWQL